MTGFKFWIMVQIKIIHQQCFSPVNPGPVNCILEDFLPHQYFLHTFEGFCRLISEGNQYLWRQNFS